MGAAPSAAPTVSTTQADGVTLLHAKELGDMLPHWYRGPDDPPAPPDYTKLKIAALALAQTPPQELRNVIRAYTWAYCELNALDAPKASGMFLLLRMLFAVPTRVEYGPYFGSWPRPHDLVVHGKYVDMSWPIHIESDAHILRVEPFQPAPQCCFGAYPALQEYDYFAARFPRRSATELEALEIR